MALRPVQFDMLRYQASFRRRARSRWLGAAVSRLVANIWKSAYLTPAQALPGFVALSHENPKIALPQTAKCGILQREWRSWWRQPPRRSTTPTAGRPYLSDSSVNNPG